MIMADFEKGIPIVLCQEGFFSDDKDDNGGTTKYGISLRFLKSLGKDGDLNDDGIVDKKDFEDLSKEIAIKLYRTSFWDANKLSLLKHQHLASFILSIAVNVGNYRCGKLIQKSLNEISRGNAVKEDGIIGTKTIGLLNDVKNMSVFIGTFALNVIGFYRDLVASNSKQRKYLLGWINRVFDFLDN
jgi:lysozyme family protein